ncbi:MAG: DUF2764 family protein [Bacteroides sp.]|nr:DUF2764 family protein [Bacteroides sp.]
MSSKYYCLVAGLPDLSPDASKLPYSVADFKDEIYPELSASDKRLVDLFYLKFDNANLLKLLTDKEAEIDTRGRFTAEELLACMATLHDEEARYTGPVPGYLCRFIAEQQAEESTLNGLPEDRLSTLYYEYAMGCDNTFVSRWFEMNLHTNNLLAALTARRYRLDVAASVVGNDAVAQALRTSNARDFGLAGEYDYLDALLKISETPDLVEREKRLDALRWNWLDEATFFDYFTVERLFAFLLKSEMLERWLSLDKEKGSQLFRSIIQGLKEQVSIPAEFK